MICPKCGNDMGDSLYCDNCNTYPFKDKQPVQWKKTLKIFGVTLGCCVLLISVIIGITSVNNHSSDETYNSDEKTVTADNTYEENNYTDDETAENNEYYSFLSENNNSLYFNITINEFLNNYNSLKSPYEDYDYKGISTDDFFYIDSGKNYNGTDITVYGCNLSIMGKNNDICIMISKDKNNTLTSLSLGVQNYNLYRGDSLTKILVQYRLLIQSLGVSESVAQSYIADMSDNLQTYNLFATYDKGLALYLDTSNSQADYYRINPYTVEQWKSASGLNQISID